MRFRFLKSLAAIRVFAALCALLLLSSLATAADLYYSFIDGTAGGVAKLVVDDRDGRVIEHVVLFRDEQCSTPYKLAVSESGQRVIVTNVVNEVGNIIVVDQSISPPGVKRLDLNAEPDEVRTFGERAIVGGDKGVVCVLDLAEGKVLSRWDARRALEPSGHRVEDILILSADRDGSARVLMTFQKDSSSGKHKGNRLVVADICKAGTLTVAHDLQLLRNRPELHYDAARNLAEQGPGPEVALASPATNTIFLSLDLYGAIALADLDAVLQGRWQNYVTLPAAVDESWGNSFPDRVVKFTVSDREFVLVANAGWEGGAALVDLSRRAIIARTPVRHGLDTLTHVQVLGKVVGTPSGKLKRRGETERDKTWQPGSELYVFEVGGSGSSDVDAMAAQFSVRAIPMGTRAFRCHAVDPTRNGLLLIAAGERDPDIIIMYDLAKEAEVLSIPAFGAVQRSQLRASATGLTEDSQAAHR